MSLSSLQSSITTVVIRHGDALWQEGKNYDIAPLSDAGKQQSLQVAEKLKVLLTELDTKSIALYANSFLRHRDTAAGIATVLNGSDRHICFYYSKSPEIGGISMIEDICSIESSLDEYKKSGVDKAIEHAKKRSYDALIIISSEPVLKDVLKKTQVGNCEGGYKKGDNDIWTPILLDPIDTK